MPKPIREYLFDVAVACDLLAMAVLGGSRNQTLSAAAWSLEKKGKLQGQVFRPLIDFLLCWYQKDHCRLQWEYEEKWNKDFTGQ